MTASGALSAISVTPCSAAKSSVAPAGERPEPLIVTGSAPGLATIAKQSPPMPVMPGSITPRSAVAAIAASTALPPFLRISMPASDAFGCEVAIIALAP